MIFLEMSRVETHGGGTWAFPNCIWSPWQKEKGGKWPFWKKVLAVKGFNLAIVGAAGRSTGTIALGKQPAIDTEPTTRMAEEIPIAKRSAGMTPVKASIGPTQATAVGELPARMSVLHTN